MTDNSTRIIDGMLFIQKVGSGQRNFVEVAMLILSMALKVESMIQKIDVVFNTYKEISIKNNERLAKDKTWTGAKEHYSSRNFKTVAEVPRHDENKSSLIQFLVQ